MSGEFELFDCDMYPEDNEPCDVCQCGVFHDDLEHGENQCGACGLPIFDVFGPTDVVYPMPVLKTESAKGGEG